MAAALDTIGWAADGSANPDPLAGIVPRRVLAFKPFPLRNVAGSGESATSSGAIEIIGNVDGAKMLSLNLGFGHYFSLGFQWRLACQRDWNAAQLWRSSRQWNPVFVS